MTAISLGMPSVPTKLAERRKSRQIMVGSVAVGGDAPVSVQSMTTTRTSDIGATLQQIAELTASCCQIVRVACPTQDDADALPEINARLARAVTSEQREIFESSALDEYLLDAERDARRRAAAVAARDEPSLEAFLPKRGDGLMLSRTQPRPKDAPNASLADIQHPIIDAYLEALPEGREPRIVASRSLFVADSREEALRLAEKGLRRVVADFAATSVGWLQQQRQASNADFEFNQTVQTRAVDAFTQVNGVNLDLEMSLLLEIERSYQATSRLISTVDQMYQYMLGAS